MKRRHVVGWLADKVVSQAIEIQQLRMEKRKLNDLVEVLESVAEYNEELRRMNENQARIINTLRRVLRFFGFDEVNIEDEMHELVEKDRPDKEEE